MDNYTKTEVCRTAGIKRRKLDCWIKKGVLPNATHVPEGYTAPKYTKSEFDFILKRIKFIESKRVSLNEFVL